MDTLNNILSKVGSALGFGGSKTPVQQTTASGQGSVNNQIVPQTMADLPQVQKVAPNLSPVAYNANNLIANLGSYVNQGPTTNYDFVGSLPNLQTPQGVFNQQTQQVENRQGQAIGAPLQVISDPLQFGAPTPTAFTPQLGIDQTVVTPTAPIQTLSTSIGPSLIPELVGAVPQKETSIGVPTVTSIPLVDTTPTIDKVRSAINNGIDATLNAPAAIIEAITPFASAATQIIRGLAGITVGALQGNSTSVVYGNLSEEIKQSLYKPGVGTSPDSPINRVGGGLMRVLEINSANVPESEKIAKIKSEFPNFDIANLPDIVNKVSAVEQKNAQKVSDIQGTPYVNTSAMKIVEVSESDRYYQNSASTVVDIVKSFTVSARNPYLKLDSIIIANRANELTSEVNRNVRQNADAFASYNTMIKKNTDVSGTLFKAFDDTTINDMISNQLDVYKWTAEAGVNGGDSHIYIKDKLKSLGYEGPLAYRNYTMQKIEARSELLPEGPEKDAVRFSIYGAGSLDDALKSIEIVANVVNSKRYYKKANAVVQGLGLEISSTVKQGGGLLGEALWKGGGARSQIFNAEQDISYVDFSEDGVGLMTHYMLDLASVAPELSSSIAMIMLANSAGAVVAESSTVIINGIGQAAKRTTRLLPVVDFGPNVGPSIKTVGSYANNVLQGGIRNIPKFADAATQELFSSSAIQGLIPGVNTAEEYDNTIIGLGLAGIIEATGPLTKVIRYGVTNSYGIAGVTEELAETMVRNTMTDKEIAKEAQKKMTEYMVGLVDNNKMTPAEAYKNAIDNYGARGVTPEEKLAITNTISKKSVSLDEIKGAQAFHQNSLDRLEMDYINNPDKAEKMSKRAYAQAKMNQIYKEASNLDNEATRIAKVKNVLGVTETEGKRFVLANQIGEDLNTVLPVRFGSQVSNPNNISTDLIGINNGPLKGYSLSAENKVALSEIDFYKPINDAQFEKMSEIGITKDSYEGMFIKSDDGYSITKDGIDKLGIIDPNNTILKSQIVLTGDDKLIVDLITSSLGEDAATLVKRTNAIDNIYNSIKNIC